MIKALNAKKRVYESGVVVAEYTVYYKSGAVRRFERMTNSIMDFMNSHSYIHRGKYTLYFE